MKLRYIINLHFFSVCVCVCVGGGEGFRGRDGQSYEWGFPLKAMNNHKNLDSSYKRDLHF